jgi:hypothetical protein
MQRFGSAMPAKRALTLLSVTVAIALAPMATTARAACDFQPLIMALADYTLANRADLPRFVGLRHGTIAAYLKLRYQKPTEGEAEAMLRPLATARVARADELLLTWAIHKFGTEEARVIAGDKATRLLLDQGYSASALRAAIARDGIAAIRTSLLAMDPEASFRIQIRVPTALLDKFDTFKSEIGRQAETAGLVQIAAGLAATQGSDSAWTDFATRLAEPQALTRALSFWYWTPALVGRPALPRAPVDADLARERERLHRVMIAAAAMPERDFLATYLNYSGRTEEAARVADTLMTVAADKTSEQAWTMDRAWVTAYLELLAVSETPEGVDSALKAISYGGLRHYDGSVRDAIDWMIAADALKDYVLGRNDSAARPGLLSPGLAADWPIWIAAADAIRLKTPVVFYHATPKMQAVMAELLFATEKYRELTDFIANARATGASVELAEDFANRLDRICYGYLNFPGEAVAFPDTPMFRFD